jgi:adenylate kinase
MGIAGSGKSMQGRLFADEQGLAWVSTGELLRVLVTGKRRQDMLKGKLLEDDVVINIIDKVFDLINLSEEFVMDGFPRTLAQAQWLIDQDRKGRINFEVIFNLTTSKEVARDRLLTRGRMDDIDETIDYRLKEYDGVTHSIINLFQTTGLPVYDIDASLSPSEVHDSILNHVRDMDLLK